MTKLQECKQFSWFQNTKKICISNSSVFQKLLLEKDMISLQIKGRHLHIGPQSFRDRLHDSSFFINTPLFIFFQINTPTITLTLHCSSTMVGGHEKQIDPNTTSTSSSASASAVSADWDIAPPLQNVRVVYLRNKNNKLKSLRKN